MSANSKILILGGTGFISSKLVDKLLIKNHDVTIFNRGLKNKSEDKTSRLHFIQGDRNKISDLKALVQYNLFDVIYDMIAYTSEQSEMAAKIFRGKTKRFIHCSTISVYMISNDVKCPITENQMGRKLMTYWDRNPFGMDYGIQKRDCESILWKYHDYNNFQLTILRPTFVSGPGDPTMRDYFWIERVLDGNPLLVPGNGNFAFQQIYIDDVANAFADLLSYPETIGEAYNLASEDIFSLNEYLLALGKLLGRVPQLVHIDQDKFDQLPISYHSMGDSFPFNVRRPAIFSLDKIKKDLKFTSTPFNEWMPKTVDWFTNTQTGHSIGYENRSEEIMTINQYKV
jgi:nucleoside-diphosphate-sugar epimerase